MKEENAPAQPVDADLPPEVQADQCLLEAEKALQNNDAPAAETAFQKIEALNIEEPPPEFFFFYGKFLMGNCNVVHLAKAVENGQVQNFLDNLLKARSFLKQFLDQAERTAANYKPALELLSACQSTIKAVTSAAKEFDELQKIKKKRAGEILLIHLAADYTEIVNALLNAATDVHATGKYGKTPLRFPVLKGQVEVMKTLLASGANANAKNDGDETPLHATSENGKTAGEEILRDFGSNRESC